MKCNTTIIITLMMSIVCLTCAAPSESVSNKYAADLPKCSPENDDIGDCVKNIINVMIPRLKDGDPELHITPYEPLILNRTTFQYNNPPVSGRFTIRSAKIYGFSTHQIESVNITTHGDKVTLHLVSKIPKMRIVGTYKADMNIRSLHIKPKGEFNLTLSDVVTMSTTQGEIYKKSDGKRYLRLTDIDAKPDIGDLQISANGIFPDPALDEVALNVANQYWRDIYGIMLPETRYYWQPLTLRMINEALDYVPIDQFINEDGSSN